ncbi:MAG: 23S rRNA (adenine(2503)-C(2))-methyltransferase RlmN [Selenomonadaceae bacterium]
MKENIFGLSLPQLQEQLKTLKLPAYRAQQIIDWMYKKHTLSFEKMTNLSQELRQTLAEEFSLFRTRLIDKQVSDDGKTTKFLLAFADGTAVETVLMRQPYGNSICVSTQAGCNMGCAFCASGINGLERNLTTGEILAQALFINEWLAPEEERVNTIVIMGSGEPLANYDNVLGFIRLCHEKYCMDMGYRNITLSTSGIVPMIERLATEDLPITLSISLHAPNNEIRSSLMPINEKYPIEQLTQAGAAYANKTKRRITYEYILIAGVNDQPEHARQLAALLRGQMASVNLIPINPVVEKGFTRPTSKQIQLFEDALLKQHLVVTVRREMGNDIQAACGQLRNKHLA